MTQQLPSKNLILYADDDTDDIEFVRHAFKNYPSVEIVDFKNGEELLHYTHHLASINVRPCLIILDVNMPRLDGKSTLKTLRSMEQYQHTPIVLYTTSTLPDEQAFAKRLNAGFITKPLYADQIKLVVDFFIEHCEDEIKKTIRSSK